MRTVILAAFAVLSLPAWPQMMSLIKQVCPPNYILVPPLPPYTTKNFCVMKYEAKQAGTIAVSRWDLNPWASLPRGNGPNSAGSAWKACRDNGPNYDLISNNEWQTIARNIADVAWNWSGNAPGSGTLNIGHSHALALGNLPASQNDVDHCLGTQSTPATCSATIWHSQRRTNRLSNGGIIWDFGGNVAELTRSYFYSNPGVNDYISDVGAISIQSQFGNDNSCTSPNSAGFCGFGYAYVDDFAGAILRGGAYYDGPAGGIFETTTNGIPSAPNDGMGFRCVFTPPNDTDPCALRNNPTPGTVCTGGAMFYSNFNGAAYMVTESNCGPGTTPTCTGGTDTYFNQYASAGGSVAGTTSSVDGATNSARADLNSGLTVAAKYCENLNWGGFTDWFLPSSTELGLSQGISSLKFRPSVSYWSSTQASGSNAFTVPFPAGVPVSTLKTASHYIRCIRKY